MNEEEISHGKPMQPGLTCGPRAVVEVQELDGTAWKPAFKEDDGGIKTFECIHEAQHTVAKMLALSWQMVVVGASDFELAVKRANKVRAIEVGEEEAKPVAEGLFTKLMSKDASK